MGWIRCFFPLQPRVKMFMKYVPNNGEEATLLCDGVEYLKLAFNFEFENLSFIFLSVPS
jgi:hypothetical protein